MPDVAGLFEVTFKLTLITLVAIVVSAGVMVIAPVYRPCGMPFMLTAMVSTAGVVPEAGETLNQLPRSTVLAAAVKVKGAPELVTLTVFG